MGQYRDSRKINVAIYHYMNPDRYKIHVFNHKFNEQHMHKYIHLSKKKCQRTKKRDLDMFTIHSKKLPGDLQISDAKSNNLEKLINVFTQRLRIMWVPQNDKRIPKMIEAFFDNTVCNDQVKQKIIEVSVWGDDF